MKAVIVNRDMEPITIVKLTPEMVRILQEDRRHELVLSCMDKPRYEHYEPTAVPEPIRFRTVHLRALVRELTVLQTWDEVDALTLDAVFLAGQQSAVNDVHERGRRHGFREGLTAMGDITSQIRRGLQQKGEDD